MLVARNSKEVGCDEAGRGCLAGPVVAAAVLLKKGTKHPDLFDSKQISKSKREFMKSWIEENALAWAVGICSPQEIDEINILNASFTAMHKALDQINLPFTSIAVDGNRFNKYKNIANVCEVKGDARVACIAAAGILAKTYRDDIMLAAHASSPMYKWNKNKGYPTKEHRKAIAEHGVHPLHRKSFKLLAQEKPELIVDQH